MQEMQEMQVPSLGWEEPLEEGVATHSGILVWEIPQTEQPGVRPSWHRNGGCPQAWVTGHLCLGPPHGHCTLPLAWSYWIFPGKWPTERFSFPFWRWGKQSPEVERLGSICCSCLWSWCFFSIGKTHWGRLHRVSQGCSHSNCQGLSKMGTSLQMQLSWGYGDGRMLLHY